MDFPYTTEAEYLALKRFNEFWAKRIADEKEHPRHLVQLTDEERRAGRGGNKRRRTKSKRVAQEPSNGGGQIL